MMTSEQHRQYATDLIRLLVRTKAEDRPTISMHAPLAYGTEDLAAVAEFMRTATVEITWPGDDESPSGHGNCEWFEEYNRLLKRFVGPPEPDPCPACGALGCTEHPTWAAEAKVRNRTQPYNIEPELPEWERELLARQAANPVEVARAHLARLPDADVRDLLAEVGADLTPAQKIRLRLTERFLVEYEAREQDSYPDMAKEVASFVLPLANMVETGQPEEVEDGPTLERWRRMYYETNDLRLVAVERLEKIIEAARIHVRMDGKMDPAAVLDVLGAKPWRDTKLAGYSGTVRIPGTDDAVVRTSGGLERVVTAQDPGGLLSEAPVAPLPVVTPNDPSRSGDDSA